MYNNDINTVSYTTTTTTNNNDKNNNDDDNNDNNNNATNNNEINIIIMIMITIIMIMQVMMIITLEGTKRATSVNVQLPCLQKDLRTGSIWQDVLNFPSELCRRRSGVFAEVARLVPPD